MAEVLLALFVVGLIVYTVAALLVKRSRIEIMNDEDPFDGEWKNGNPNDPLPEEAKVFVVDTTREEMKRGMGPRKVVFKLEED